MAIHARTLQCVSATALVGGLVCAPAHAVSVGLTDTFAGVSTAGWSTGGASPVPPAAQAGGGPAGAADPYLLLRALGNAGAGGRLVAFSGAQWAGDYLQAGVSAISLDANNLGSTDLALRLVLEAAQGNAVTQDVVLLPAASGWRHVDFSIRPAALTGAGAAVLSDVLRYRLIHNPDATALGPFVLASLGVDNISAVPEPELAALCAAGLAVLGLAGWQRQRQRRQPCRYLLQQRQQRQQRASWRTSGCTSGCTSRCTSGHTSSGLRPASALALVLGGALMPAAQATTVLPAITFGDVAVQLQAVATGLAAPDYAISAPGDTNRLFVVEQNGLLRVIQNGNLMATPALDIRSLVAPPLVTTNANDERGFLGLAFHPDFNKVGSLGYGTLYTYASELIQPGAAPTFAAPNNATQGYQNAINEWKMEVASGQVDPNSRRELVSFGKNANNHNGGTISFGKDGYLYLGLGDGGNANDVGASHISPGGNAQNLSTPLGKMLRIDPLNPALNSASTDAVSANGRYRIPSGNPFQGAGQVKEVFAYGFRNPYRFSFDRLNGDLIAADVGQNSIEEVDRVVLGGNYGWAIKEGDFSFNQVAGPGGAAGTIGARSPGSPANLIDPITGTLGTLEYDHGDGISITGGFVYRGSAIAQLYGKYVFGDLALRNAPRRVDGRLFYADLQTGEIRQFLLPQFSNNGLPDGLTVHGFGEDAAGELYALVTNTASGGTGGTVYRIAAVPEPASGALLGLGALLLAWRCRRRPAARG